MGEVVVSSSSEEEGIKVEMEAAGDEVAERESRSKRQKKDGLPAAEVVQWERFLPRMVLRVLLVEADDSTRQIIAALLRKCSYKVSAVPDGLKAWETLKGKPHSIDLVLTEVELPSISGFTLLTLVMEHDVCKNIPVIMMSSHDSISMVLKCMLKGAADFLIKPVRKNELRNLWQHVWRRHILTGGDIPQNLTVTEQKVEPGSENNTASNHSSDYVVSSHRDKECSETGSDAQGLSKLKRKSASNLSNSDIEKQEEHVKLAKESVFPESEAEEKSSRFRSEVAPSNQAYDTIALRLEEDHACAKAMTHYKAVGPESTGNANKTSEINGCSNEPDEPYNGAVDLIGTFDNRQMCSHVHSSSVSSGSNKYEYVPHLELSLRRFCPSSLKDDRTDERHALNHSSASAFSWYNNNTTLHSLLPTLASNCTELKEGTDKIYDLLSDHCSEYTVGTDQQHDATLGNNQENKTKLIDGQSGQAEIAFPRPQLGLVPIPGLRYDDVSEGYGHLFPSIFFSKSGMTPVWSPKPNRWQKQSPFLLSTSIQANTEINNSKQGYHRSDETSNNCDDHTVNQQNYLESIEELRHDSPAAGQSSSSSLCNGITTQHNNGVYGSISSRRDGVTTAVTEKASAPEISNDGGLITQDGIRGTGSHRSSQREAALTKFRQKRKDRCFEKKVRYQSRKRLAEQRPRVKGQFVRQVQTSSSVAGADDCLQES